MWLSIIAATTTVTPAAYVATVVVTAAIMTTVVMPTMIVPAVMMSVIMMTRILMAVMVLVSGSWAMMIRLWMGASIHRDAWIRGDSNWLDRLLVLRERLHLQRHHWLHRLLV